MNKKNNPVQATGLLSKCKVTDFGSVIIHLGFRIGKRMNRWRISG